MAKPFTAAVDASDAELLAAIVVIGCKAGKRRGLLARDLPDLGQAHEDGNGSWQPDAIDALDQIEPLGKVGMLTDG